MDRAGHYVRGDLGRPDGAQAVRVRADAVLMADTEITVLRPSAQTRRLLSEILIDVVANGGSVSFMHPLGAAVVLDTLSMAAPPACMRSWDVIAPPNGLES